MLFLPWVGLILGGLQEPHAAGWILLGPVLLAGSPIALYLTLEQLELRRARRGPETASWRRNEKGPGFRRGLQSLEGL